MHALARLLVLFIASALCLASASSTSNEPPAQYGVNQQAPTLPRAPTPVAMVPSVATGLWKTNFGPVKIEANLQAGSNALMGVWVYNKAGREIIGYFSGDADGNVLPFTWQEPSTAGDSPLTGSGFLVFDPEGGSFTGRWWSTTRDRSGDFNGWRSQR